MINEKDFEQAIAETRLTIVNVDFIHTGIHSALSKAASPKVFELAKQMAKEHNSELIKALDEIANPIKHMQQRLKDGEQLNGGMAIALAKDASYLREIAEKALREYSGTPASSLAQEAEGKEVDALTKEEMALWKQANIETTNQLGWGRANNERWFDEECMKNYLRLKSEKLPSPPSSNKIN